MLHGGQARSFFWPESKLIHFQLHRSCSQDSSPARHRPLPHLPHHPINQRPRLQLAEIVAAAPLKHLPLLLLVEPWTSRQQHSVQAFRGPRLVGSD